MRAVVLVGGEGTRLRPLTLTVPKQMLAVAEVPMIERVVRHLGEYGVDEVVLSLGYRPDPFLATFPDDRCGKVRVRYAVEPEPLDTAGAIRFAAAAVGIDDTFVALNGDVLSDVDIGDLIAFHRAKRAEATIHLHRVSDPSAFGVVVCDDDGRVLQFVEKPPAAEAPADTINAGCYVLEASVLDRIAAGVRVSMERNVFPALTADATLYALATDSYWLDTGTPAQYIQAHLDLISGVRPGPAAPGAVADHGGVWTLGESVIDGMVTAPALVGPAAYVQSGATVVASVVGSGARVHEAAVVRGSVLLAGAVVRNGARVEDSIVGRGAVIGEQARVSGLSVIGDGFEVAPGAELVGARRPEST